MPSIRLVPPDDYPTLGWVAIDWIETYLCHGPGDVEGEPLVLDDEFCQLLLDAYRLYPEGHELEGQRVARYFELSRAKGRAKSELAAAIVCFEFVGPCRFSHWDPETGEPVGQRVRSPFIRCLATEEGQTGNTYSGVEVMLRHGLDQHPDVFAGVDVGITRTFCNGEHGRGEIRPSSAAASSKDGGRETFAVADEVHLYNSPELRKMHQMVRRNVRKRKGAQGWMFATTTMFAPGEDSVGEQNWTEAQDQLAHPRRRRIGFCRDHREGTEVEDWSNDDQVLESLREAYGPAAEWMDLRSILDDEIRAPGSTQAESQRYWLNQRATVAGRAVNVEDWDAMADPGRVVPDGVDVVLCFDGSKLDETTAKDPDTTALCAWVLEPGRPPHLVEVDCWDPKAVDRHGLRREVNGRIAECFSRWNVRRLVADPPYWRDELDGWSDEYGEDLVLAFETGSAARMGPAVERIVREAVPGRSFTHDGSDRLRKHALNCVLTKTRRGGWDALAKPKETEKIDLFVAATIGYHELPNIEPAKPKQRAIVATV